MNVTKEWPRILRKDLLFPKIVGCVFLHPTVITPAAHSPSSFTPSRPQQHTVQALMDTKQPWAGVPQQVRERACPLRELFVNPSLRQDRLTASYHTPRHTRPQPSMATARGAKKLRRSCDRCTSKKIVSRAWSRGVVRQEKEGGKGDPMLPLYARTCPWPTSDDTLRVPHISFHVYTPTYVSPKGQRKGAMHLTDLPTLSPFIPSAATASPPARIASGGGMPATTPNAGGQAPRFAQPQMSTRNGEQQPRPTVLCLG